MVTRIDKLLGTEIFQSMQDVVPRNIGIMVGIAHTSGELVTGKRKYETCSICRELINPCIADLSYSCEQNLCGISQICHGGRGNNKCTDSDKKAGNHARRTNMTVLYRCFFGLANYAIPVKIGELGSIILYGGQFRIKESNDPRVIEDYQNGRKYEVSEQDFRKLVFAVVKWREKKKRARPAHLPLHARRVLMREYMDDQSDPNLPKTIRVTEITLDKEKKGIEWELPLLEDLLLKRWNLSLFEAWDEFLEPPSKDVTSARSLIKRNGMMLASYRIKEAALIESPYLDKAEEAYKKYEDRMIDFFYNPSKLPPDDYQNAVISLRKAFFTIELLKELAILISMMANVVFYKETYFGLRNLWDVHPISIVESSGDRWNETEALLERLDTTGREIVPSAGGPRDTISGTSTQDISKHLSLVRDLTKNLMFFAYKMLSDNFRSLALILRSNYGIKHFYRDLDQDAVDSLIEQTKEDFVKIETVSCLFVMDLLEAKYEQLIEERTEARTGRQRIEEDLRKLGRMQRIIKRWSSPLRGLVNNIRSQLERYNEEGKEIEDFRKLQDFDKWRSEVFELLKATVEERDWIRADDIMLRFFDSVFGKSQLQDNEQELDKIGTNFRWADATIRKQVENVSTSVLQFDVSYSFLQFLQRLREDVYAKRFVAIKKIAQGEQKRAFENVFMPPATSEMSYFVDHGIDHANKVLGNMEAIVDNLCFEQKQEPNKPITAEAQRVSNILKCPLWQYYLKCAGILHDVGMFSEKFYSEVYGGPVAVRRCHGAFSGKRIVEEEQFGIFGNELDRRIIAQVCSFHDGEADLNQLNKNVQPLAALLRIADEFDVSRRRFRGAAYKAHLSEVKEQTRLLRDDLNVLNTSRNSTLQLPEKPTKEDIEALERDILLLAEKENRGDLWPVDVPCFEFVQKYPTISADTLPFVNALKRCSRIKDALAAVYHHEKHKCVQDVTISIRKRGGKTCVVPEIRMAEMSLPIPDESIPVEPEKQPRIVAERVKIKFEKEIDSVKKYLEPLGILFSKPRIVLPNGRMRNLLFVNAPSCKQDLKFTGAPTSLLYAIAPICAIIDGAREQYKDLKIDHGYGFRYEDVNIELWDPEILNNETEKELEGIMEDFKPRIVGISNTSASHYNAVRIAKIIKEKEPNTIVIFGGPHENVRYKETIKRHHGFVDISLGGVKKECGKETRIDKSGSAEEFAIVQYRAEAEYALCKITMQILSREDNQFDLPDLLNNIAFNRLAGNFGVAFYDLGDVQFIENANDELDIDKLPLIPRYLLDHANRYNYSIFRDKISGRFRKTAQMITTRGCIHKCTFCSSSGKSLRRKWQQVIDELTRLKREGCEAVFFDDSTFADECGNKLTNEKCPYTDDFCPKAVGQDRFELLNAKSGLIYEQGKCGYAIKLCHEMISQGLGLIWGCQTRVDAIYGKLVKTMKEAGCEYVYFGVESMNEKALQEMHKDLNPKQIQDGIRAAASEGLSVGISLVFGLEQEKLDEKLLELLRRKEIPNSIKETVDGVVEMMKWPDPAGSRINCVSINIATAYPGTVLEMLFQKEQIEPPNFDDPPKDLNEYPHDRFEEAGWNKLPFLAFERITGVDPKHVAQAIVDYCKEKIGDRLIISAT